MLEKMRTRSTVKVSNLPGRFPLPTLLALFIITDKITFESSTLTAIKWALYGGVSAIAIVWYMVLKVTEKAVDIFDVKNLQKPDEGAKTRENKFPFNLLN